MGTMMLPSPLLLLPPRTPHCTSSLAEVLHQLKQKKERDPTVLHNIAIAEYFQDGCSDPKKLLDVLNSVKKNSEDLAYASGGTLEVASNLGNKYLPGSKGYGMTTQQFSPGNSGTLVHMDGFSPSVATLNITTSLHVCLLLPLLVEMHPSLLMCFSI